MESQRIRQESASEQQLCPKICGWCDKVSEERGRKGVVVPNTNKRNSWPFGVHGLVYKLVGKTGKDRRKISRCKGELGRLQRLAGPQSPSSMEAPSALSLQDPQWFTDLWIPPHYPWASRLSLPLPPFWKSRLQPLACCCYCSVARSCLTLLQAHGLQPPRLLCSWNSPG